MIVGGALGRGRYANAVGLEERPREVSEDLPFHFGKHRAHVAEQIATVCVQVVVGVLGMLHDSTAIRVEVVFRAVVEVRLDSVDTAYELPCLVH